MFAFWLVIAGVMYCALIVAKAANKTISYENGIIWQWINHSFVFKSNIRLKKSKVEKGQIVWVICANCFSINWMINATQHLFLSTLSYQKITRDINEHKYSHLFIFLFQHFCVFAILSVSDHIFFHFKISLFSHSISR